MRQARQEDKKGFHDGTDVRKVSYIQPTKTVTDFTDVRDIRDFKPIEMFLIALQNLF